jgi:hypothetical protein
VLQRVQVCCCFCLHCKCALATVYLLVGEATNCDKLRVCGPGLVGRAALLRLHMNRGPAARQHCDALSPSQLRACLCLLLSSGWEVGHEEIEICRHPGGEEWLLGEGRFGKVYKALKGGVQVRPSRRTPECGLWRTLLCLLRQTLVAPCFCSQRHGTRASLLGCGGEPLAEREAGLCKPPWELGASPAAQKGTPPSPRSAQGPTWK